MLRGLGCREGQMSSATPIGRSACHQPCEMGLKYALPPSFSPPSIYVSPSRSSWHISLMRAFLNVARGSSTNLVGILMVLFEISPSRAGRTLPLIPATLALSEPPRTQFASQNFQLEERCTLHTLPTAPPLHTHREPSNSPAPPSSPQPPHILEAPSSHAYTT